jgi:hypothetical protein
MSTASWPFSPRQCPQCRYLQPFNPPIADEDGYDVMGFCRQPRIGMELFQLKTRLDAQPSCPCFFLHSPRVVSPHRL